jgi:hypothetical protein
MQDCSGTNLNQGSSASLYITGDDRVALFYQQFGRMRTQIGNKPE